jgi:hypothetical protein
MTRAASWTLFSGSEGGEMEGRIKKEPLGGSGSSGNSRGYGLVSVNTKGMRQSP